MNKDKSLTIKVYFETKTHAELIVCFADEETYINCLPALEKQAEKQGYFITESIEEDTLSI